MLSYNYKNYSQFLSNSRQLSIASQNIKSNIGQVGPYREVTYKVNNILNKDLIENAKIIIYYPNKFLKGPSESFLIYDEKKETSSEFMDHKIYNIGKKDDQIKSIEFKHELSNSKHHIIFYN